MGEGRNLLGLHLSPILFRYWQINIGLPLGRKDAEVHRSKYRLLILLHPFHAQYW